MHSYHMRNSQLIPSTTVCEDVLGDDGVATELILLRCVRSHFT